MSLSWPGIGPVRTPHYTKGIIVKKDKITTTKGSAPAPKPYDVAQCTILVDSSDSMHPFAHDVQRALGRIVADAAKADGTVVAIRQFARTMTTLSDFGASTTGLVPYYPEGRTRLFGSIGDAVEMSRRDAELTPELRTHHVVIVITDGYDNLSTEGEIEACRRSIAAVDVDATFVVLDFSGTGRVTDAVGLRAVPLQLNHASFKAAMDKVSAALGTIGSNIVNELPPATGLLLPPARPK